MGLTRLSRLDWLGGPSLRRSIALTFAGLAVIDVLLLVGAAIIVFNLIADILYGVLDPRIRYE